jgi:hypothetical protein
VYLIALCTFNEISLTHQKKFLILLFKFYYFQFLKLFIFNFLIFLHYDTCLLSGVDTWTTISFLIEKLTEVPIRSFLKTQVLSVIRIETQGVKNKVFKPQVPKMYLTIFFIRNIIKSAIQVHRKCNDPPPMTQYCPLLAPHIRLPRR